MNTETNYMGPHISYNDYDDLTSIFIGNSRDFNDPEQIRPFAQGLADMRDGLHNGSVTEDQAIRHLTDGIPYVFSAIEESTRGETVDIDGVEYFAHPKLHQAVALINENLRSDQEPFTAEGLAKLQVDLSRANLHDRIQHEFFGSAEPLSFALVNGVGQFYDNVAVDDYFLNRDHLVQTYPYGQASPKDQGLVYEPMETRNGYFGQFTYPEYSEQLGHSLGIDEYTYDTKVYESYMALAERDYDAFTSDRVYGGAANLESQMNQGKSFLFYADRAAEALQRIEPGLSEDAYKARVSSNFPLYQDDPEGFFDTTVRSYAAAQLENGKRNVHDFTSASLGDCRETGNRDLAHRHLISATEILESNLSGISHFGIDVDTTDTVDLIAQIGERAEELDAPWRKVPLIGGLGDPCRPILE